jgi:hypothetical protein
MTIATSCSGVRVCCEPWYITYIREDKDDLLTSESIRERARQQNTHGNTDTIAGELNEIIVGPEEFIRLKFGIAPVATKEALEVADCVLQVSGLLNTFHSQQHFPFRTI